MPRAEARAPAGSERRRAKAHAAALRPNVPLNLDATVFGSGCNAVDEPVEQPEHHVPFVGRSKEKACGLAACGRVRFRCRDASADGGKPSTDGLAGCEHPLLRLLLGGRV